MELCVLLWDLGPITFQTDSPLTSVRADEEGPWVEDSVLYREEDDDDGAAQCDVR